MYLLISAGPSYTRLNNTRNIALNNAVVNRYETAVKVRGGQHYQFGIGYQFSPRWLKYFRLAIDSSGGFNNQASVNGLQRPFINAGRFATLDYRFYSHSYFVLVEPKISYQQYALAPFFQFGLGYSKNRLENYQETPTVTGSGATPVPQPFRDYSKHDVIYSLKVGVEKQMYQNNNGNFKAKLGLSYQYVNFGRANLRKMPTQTTRDRLGIKNIDVRAMLLTLMVYLK